MSNFSVFFLLVLVDGSHLVNIVVIYYSMGFLLLGIILLKRLPLCGDFI